MVYAGMTWHAHCTNQLPASASSSKKYHMLYLVLHRLLQGQSCGTKVILQTRHQHQCVLQLSHNELHCAINVSAEASALRCPAPTLLMTPQQQPCFNHVLAVSVLMLLLLLLLFLQAYRRPCAALPD